MVSYRIVCFGVLLPVQSSVILQTATRHHGNIPSTLYINSPYTTISKHLSTKPPHHARDNLLSFLWYAHNTERLRRAV
ncbi:uncharacterized protein ASPGLDRAFT_40836 [Aspergillus glaucus CBS 516.65]|uniref:Secreted protein n=1 Tax=Aspergillus glaucus CBS 516.65 TaxID=1160497 RepID=A0A1L9VYG9_ASPGL|nr:hypothetical protein ASPGLDRAFT_40836 [Aspergillus glaucus CBS 516.65]OJJ88945.1 hypothetical protein ASPGLDRAFT_40836 [Aspergillus glaucus CBS 516.65]